MSLSPGNGYFAYEKALILGKWDFLQFAWKQASKQIEIVKPAVIPIVRY